MWKYLGFSLVSTALSVVAAILVINSGALQGQIEKRVQAQTGLPVQLGRISVLLRWPITMRIRATQVATQDLQAQFQTAYITFRSLFEPRDFGIILQQPKLVLAGAVGDYSVGSSTQSGGGAAAAGAGREEPGRFGLSLQIIDGEFRAKDLALRDLDFTFAQRLWMKTPAQVDFSAHIKSALFPSEFPVSVQTENLLFSDEAIKAMAVKASVAGLDAGMQISSLLKEGRHRMVLDIKAPDLSRVPAPFNIPAKDWQGGVEVFAEVVKAGPDKGWAAEGRAVLKAVKANLNWSSETAKVSGPAVADFNGQFSYVDGKLSLPAMKGDLDLTQAQVEARDILNKPPHTKLKLNVEASGSSDKTIIKKLEAELWQLKSTTTGSLILSAPYMAGLQVEIAPTPLKGIESILIPIKNSPVEGELMLQANWEGPLNDPRAARIVLRKLQLKKFAANVSYDTGGAMKARGPVAANLEARGELDRGQPKTFEASGQMQLDSLALAAGPFRKDAGQPLGARFVISSDGTSLQVRPLAITGFLGKVSATGRVRDPLKPDLNLRVEMSPLDLSELRMALPAQRESIPKGSVSGFLNLNGRVETASPWAEWPLVVTGDLKVQIPEYVLGVAAAEGEVDGVGATPGAPAEPAENSPPSGFLPKGPLTEKLNLGLGVSVGVLKKEPLAIKGLVSDGRISGGIFAGKVTINEIFGGKVEVSQLAVPMLEPLPKMNGNALYAGVIVQDVLEFIKPEFKTFATGRAAGSTQFATRLPADARFMDELTARGRMTLEPITFNTLKLGEIVNDLSKKVPGVKLPPAKMDPLKGVVKGEYALEAQALTLSSLVGRDEDGSELNVKGKVILPTLTGDLVGHFAWAQNEVKGCVFEGNSDAEGRLVVPLAIKGSLLNPEMGMVADTVGKLAGRALECEKKKLLEQVQKDGGKKLETEAKKVLKGIFGK